MSCNSVLFVLARVKGFVGRSHPSTTSLPKYPSHPAIPLSRSIHTASFLAEDGTSRIEVRLEGGTVWLTQALIAELFQTTKQNISLHVRNIFEERELQLDSVVKEYLTTASHSLSTFETF